MTVYFIKHRNLSPIKIGYTDDLTKRIYSFNNASPYGIEVIGTIETENASRLEKEIHNKLSAFRIRGEWFEITENHAKSIVRMYTNIDYIDAKNSFEMDFNNKKEPLCDEHDLKSFFSSLMFTPGLRINKNELYILSGLQSKYTQKKFSRSLSRYLESRGMDFIEGKSGPTRYIMILY